MHFALVNAPNRGMLVALSKGRKYHLVLAQYVLDHPEYAEFFREESKKSYILMDNGTDEGVSLDPASLLTAAHACGADEVVLPDTILDPISTYWMSRKFLKYVNEKTSLFFCYVLQMRTLADLQGNLSNLQQIYRLAGNRLRSVAITKDFEPFGGSRIAALHALFNAIRYTELETLRVHLLGIWNDPYEVAVIERRFPGRIRGVDSSLPLVYAYHGIRIRHGGVREGQDVDLESWELEQDFQDWRQPYIVALQDMDYLARGMDLSLGYEFPTWDKDTSSNGT